MRKTLNMVGWARAALNILLLAASVVFVSAAACAQTNQCVKGKIGSQSCWVGLEVSGNSITVSPSDVALVSNTSLSWKRTDSPSSSGKPEFTVDFDRNDCTPFNGVFHVAPSTPPPPVDPLPAGQFERCRYKVTIGDLTADAQVIVIGGGKRHTTSWSKRHLGEW